MRSARELLFGLLALGLAGGAQSAFAQTPSSLPVAPPQIVAEAGVLPGGPLGALDRFAELLDRTVFSFGVPALRARIALTQAAERVAELQTLERNGQRTPEATRALLAAHRRLVDSADRIVARQVLAGRVSTGLLLLLTRTRLAAAEVLQALADELAVEVELAAVEEEAGADAAEDVADPRDVLEDAQEDLIDVEEDILPARLGPGAVPAAVLRLLAEQKIAKAERDLLAAAFKVEERLAHGKVLLADVELRAAAESLLVTARQLFAAGNSLEALALAKQARALASRLASGKIAVEPGALLAEGGENTALKILADLVEEGLIGSAEQATAELRARAAVEQIRQSRP